MSIGPRLRRARENARLTLGQVGEYENLTKQYLSRLELEVNQPPAWDLIRRLAMRYNTTTDYLLGLTDDPAPRPAPSTLGSATFLPSHDEIQLLAIYNDLGDDQQDALLAVAKTFAGTDERSRRRILRALVDSLFDDIAATAGQEHAEALMAAIDTADRLNDPSTLLAWLRARLAPTQQAPD